MLSRFLTPTYDGELPGAHGTGVEGNVTCGDVVQVGIRIEQGRVAEARFLARGCTVAIAGADAICELVRGMTLSAAQTLTIVDVQRAVGPIPDDRSGCAEIVLSALRQAVEQARSGVTSSTA